MAFAFPESKAKWILLGVTTVAAFYVFSKMYNKNTVLQPLGEGEVKVSPKRKNSKKKKKKKSKKKKAMDVWDYTNNELRFENPKAIKVESPVDVFLRMRPLIKHEIEQKHEQIEYGIETKKKKKVFKFSTMKRSKMREMPFKGLSNVILPKDKNIDVFRMAITPCIDALFGGTRCAAFAYGHSGSGKTHTMFGYKEEVGLHRLFANECLKRLSKTGMFLEVRFVELYRGKFRDLLSDDKDTNEINLFESEKSEFIFCRPPAIGDDGKYRRIPITSVRVSNADELEQAIAKGISSRTVGDSTVHDQSSRSHAFVEYEIVNDALKKKRGEIMEMEADLLWLQVLYDSLIQLKKSGLLSYPKALHDKINAELVGVKSGQMYSRLQRAEAKMDKLNKEMIKIIKGHPALSKTMVFVDLAGNEYARDALKKDETAEQKKERKQITADLVALKECVRALHGKNRTHIPYRTSNLTKYLRSYLGEEDSKAVMISTIGISKEMTQQTLNTLNFTGFVANA